MDARLHGYSPTRRIALTIAEVTETAQNLEQRHLAGPTAGRVLAEALAGVTLMSANLGHKEERISLQLKTNGPVGGVMVDAGHDGGLRGYPNIKILNQFDGDDTTPLSEALGSEGGLTVIQSTSERILSSARLRVDPPDVRTAVARYFNESLQRPSAVELSIRSKDSRIEHAVGIWAEKMPDALSEDFVPVLEAFDDGRVRAFLDNTPEWEGLRELFGLPDLQLTKARDMKFHCNCSIERVLGSLASLGRDELESIAATGEAQSVSCQFCGADYLIQPTQIRELIDTV